MTKERELTWVDYLEAFIIAMVIIFVFYELGVFAWMSQTDQYSPCNNNETAHCSPGCPNYTSGYCVTY